jgi:predicted nucleic acid-binding protein
VNGWLLDTNVIAELNKPNSTVRVRNWVAAQDDARLYLSILTIGEYSKGLHNVPQNNPLSLRIAAYIAALEVRFADRILTLTDAIVRRWGTISGETKRLTGHAPPVVDTLLAATAIEHDLCLVTRNVRDVRHSGARLLNPWDADAGGQGRQGR